MHLESSSLISLPTGEPKAYSLQICMYKFFQINLSEQVLKKI